MLYAVTHRPDVLGGREADGEYEGAETAAAGLVDQINQLNDQSSALL